MINLTNISKQYGPHILYKNASMQINRGEKLGLVGPNGAGKSTIFKIIMGEEGVDSGNVGKPEKCLVGYFSQNVAEMSGKSVLNEVLESSGKISELSREIQVIESRLAESATNPLSDDDMTKMLERYGDIQHEFEERGGYDLDTRAKEILTGLGIGPADFNRSTDSFSGGWKMRIELAKILLLNPDVLLMDEPTNHLDVETITWLEAFLVSFKGAILMTSHDRDFMNRIVSKIVEVANKNITTYGGNYDFYEKERDIRREQLKAQQSRQEAMFAKEEEFIARFAARASHAAQVQSRVKKLEKLDRVELPPEEESISFSFPTPQRGGDEVAKFSDLKKIWSTDDVGDKLVFEGAQGRVARGDRVAVVGVNGAGKSTLLKVIAGQTDPTSGICQIGPSIRVGYFSQSSVDVLTPKKTVMQEIHDRLPQASVGYIRNLLAAFQFRGDEVEKKISVLSGGEKSRLVLATLLTESPNFLILDEPTNHLDIRSRETLLHALKTFEGTVMLVSHDRFFLRALATRVLELDKSRVIPYEGNYEYYLWKKAEAAQQA